MDKGAQLGFCMSLFFTSYDDGSVVYTLKKHCYRSAPLQILYSSLLSNILYILTAVMRDGINEDVIYISDGNCAGVTAVECSALLTYQWV